MPPQFDLKNADTFGSIVGYKDVVASSTQLQEEETTYRYLTDQLTLYQDTIEVQLLQEISRRSASFFGALENLQQLEKETEMILDNFGGKKIVPITKLPARCTPKNLISST